MGIEYRILTDGAQRVALDALIDTLLCGVNGHAVRHADGLLEIRFQKREGLPDAMISHSEDGLIFTFNTGLQDNFALFGTLISLLTGEFSCVTVKEI